jgi:hypothetical protein
MAPHRDSNSPTSGNHIVSVLASTEQGQSAETSIVGREGMSG